MANMEKRGEVGTQKCEFLKKEKSFLDEIKSVFHNYLKAIICWENEK